MSIGLPVQPGGTRQQGEGGEPQGRRQAVAALQQAGQERHQRPGAAHPGVILLRQGAGLRRTNLLSTELAGFVSACDGQLSVRQIVSALVALLGGDDTFDEDAFREGLFSEVTNLVLDGFLLPDPERYGS